MDKNYRMSKPVKTYLNMILNDPDKKAAHKSLFVEAESHAENSRRKMSVKVLDTNDEE